MLEKKKPDHLTDMLGSVLASSSNTYNNAASLGNQTYGSPTYQSGNLGTNKGYTVHYADATGLDYYNARYYDPVASVFLSGACSFLPQTLVSTTHGEQPIGKLHVGDTVWAYNPKTHTLEREPVLHVWIHQDNDLVDLTITTHTTVRYGLRSTTSTTREVIHTNQKHPFYTIEQGFLSVSQITVGMHLLRADGQVGVVTGRKVVSGVQTMYNLEVAQDHTFTVGDGMWVVHNCSFPGPDIGTQREAFVVDNLDTLIPDSGNIVGTRTPLLTGRGSTDIDIETEKAVIEIGGPMKGMTPQSFANQLGKLQTYALQEGKGLYFLYDESAGPISLALQGIADKYGATVVPFTL